MTDDLSSDQRETRAIGHLMSSPLHQQLMLAEITPEAILAIEEEGTNGGEVDVDPMLDVPGDENRDLASEEPCDSDQAVAAIKSDARSGEQIRVSESRYRRLFETARDGILVLDPHTRKITDANPFMTELLGYTHRELLGQELWEIGLLSDETANRAAFHELKQMHFVRYEDLPLQTKDGKSRQVEFVSNLYEEGGKDVIQCNIRDITERKWAEERIAEQAAFLEKAKDAIVACDPEGRISFWNLGAERMYGWTNKEVLRRNIGDVLCLNWQKYNEFHHLTLTRDEWSGEVRHQTKSRGEILVDSHWTLIRDSVGHPKTVLAINTDVTEKKQLEIHAKRAQRMESLGTLAGGIAHDLNNILAPIVMSIEVLEKKSVDQSTKALLKTIEICAKRGADIVRQVLSFARGLEGARIEVEPKLLIEDLESIIKGTFPKDICIHFSFATHPCKMLGDPTQVHLVLLNLCVNARDAMPHGGDLNIGVEPCLSNERLVANVPGLKVGRYVKISIADSGMGIPADVIDRIFDPFFTTKDLTKGTGLGLSTVMAIVKSHDGTIFVTSEPGHGSQFDVYFPAMDIAEETGNFVAKDTALPRGHGETILVVDDEVCILAVTGHTLEAFGYQVLKARDGAEAVAMYLRHREEIAVVLTDMMMPVMDGRATIHALMRINPQVKIIAASGIASNGGAAKAAGTGVKHFLSKPYTAALLLDNVRSIIEEV